MIKAAITPGIHPKQVRINTITIEPHPLSITAKGGKIIQSNTRKHPMVWILRINFSKVLKIILQYNVIRKGFMVLNMYFCSKP